MFGFQNTVSFYFIIVTTVTDTSGEPILFNIAPTSKAQQSTRLVTGPIRLNL
jgi:hypothetical protein